MVRSRIGICSPCQLCPNTGRTYHTLTVDNQFWNARSIAKGVVVRFEFEDMEGIRPVAAFSGGLAALMGGDKVGDSWGDIAGHVPRQNLKDIVCGLHQGPVERPPL
jgi:hypothetical protein